MVRENIAEYHIGHCIGGQDVHRTRQAHVYFIECPQQPCPLCVDFVVIIQLWSHGSFPLGDLEFRDTQIDAIPFMKFAF